MNVLDDVLNRRLINTLRDQVSKVLSHMLFEDINIKPIEAPEFITLKIKVNRNA